MCWLTDSQHINTQIIQFNHRAVQLALWRRIGKVCSRITARHRERLLSRKQWPGLVINKNDCLLHFKFSLPSKICLLSESALANWNRLHLVKIAFIRICWGYWHQLADERFGDPPQGGSRSLQWSETGMEGFCVCSRNVLLGDLLGVSRSRERDLLSVLSIYPRIFLFVLIMYRGVVRILCLLLYSAICWCVLVALV